LHRVPPRFQQIQTEKTSTRSFHINSYPPPPCSTGSRVQVVPRRPSGPIHIRHNSSYRGADKSLVRPGRKQATATEDFVVHISYLLL